MATTRKDMEVIFLASSIARTVTYTGPTVEVRGSHCVAYLNSSASSGTAETLDVTIEAVDPAGNVYVIGTFAQQTAAGSLRLVTGLDPLLDHNIRAVLTIGGTTPSFTASVCVVVKED